MVLSIHTQWNGVAQEAILYMLPNHKRNRTQKHLQGPERIILKGQETQAGLHTIELARCAFWEVQYDLPVQYALLYLGFCKLRKQLDSFLQWL